MSIDRQSFGGFHQIAPQPRARVKKEKKKEESPKKKKKEEKEEKEKESQKMTEFVDNVSSVAQADRSRARAISLQHSNFLLLVLLFG